MKVVDQNSTSCSLITGKSKLAPMKNKLVTIPRLELQAALMASRINVTILDQMDMGIDSVFLWSDSETVLNYLRNTKTNFGPYIMRRCNEIRVNTHPLRNQYFRYFVMWHLIRQIPFIKYLVLRSRVFNTQ